MADADVTKILSRVEHGDPSAAEELLPLVYDELRRLAQARLAYEQPGQTLQATALVHEAYLRLVNVDVAQSWDSRGHFFSAAAEAMRRILVENARRKKTHKRGGDRKHATLQEADAAIDAESSELLELNEAIEKLAVDDPPVAEVAKLRLFAGLSVADAADALNISRTTAFRRWKYAEAWLTTEMHESGE